MLSFLRQRSPARAPALQAFTAAETVVPNGGAAAAVPAPPARVYAYLGPEIALTQLDDGHFIYVDPSDQSLSAQLIARGYWERWVETLVGELVRPGMQAVEVGANLGYFTVKMARDVGPGGHLHAFEANPAIFGLLSRSVELNGYLGRVTLSQAAVSNTAGALEFTVSRDFSGGGHIALAAEHLAGDWRRVTVPAVMLDGVLAGPSIDFLRIDAEGSELMIFEGAERLLAGSRNLRICLEWDVVQLQSRCDVAAGIRRLKAGGFKFWKIEHDATLREVPADRLIELPHCDMIACRSYPV